jgi:hypothetical protein
LEISDPIEFLLLQILYFVMPKIPKRDPRRKQLILQLRRDHPSMKNWEIAARADCTDEYARSVLKKNAIASRPPQAARESAPPGPEAAAQNPSWYVKSIETDLVGLRAAMDGEPRDRLGREKPSTNLIDPSRVRPITRQELEANTFKHDLHSTDPGEIKRAREWLRSHFKGSLNRGRKGSQGFAIMSAHSSKAAVFEDFSRLCDHPRYTREFKTIFQRLQNKKPAGDKKRKQAKMTVLLELAATRLEEAQKIVDQKTKNKSQNGKKNTKKEAALAAALQVLEQTKKDHSTVMDAVEAMCSGYQRIQQVVSRCPSPPLSALSVPPSCLPVVPLSPKPCSTCLC